MSKKTREVSFHLWGTLRAIVDVENLGDDKIILFGRRPNKKNYKASRAVAFKNEDCGVDESEPITIGARMCYLAPRRVKIYQKSHVLQIKYLGIYRHVLTTTRHLHTNNADTMNHNFIIDLSPASAHPATQQIRVLAKSQVFKHGSESQHCPG